MVGLEPRERAVRALELEEPDRVPMFELEFQYPEEIVGVGYVLSPNPDDWTKTVFKDFLKQDQKMTVKGKGLDVTEHNTLVLAETCKKLGYDIIRVAFVPDQNKALKMLRKIAPDRLIAGSAGGTLGIPDGKNMAGLVHQVFSKPDELKRQMDETIAASVESIKEQADAGAELVFDCTDYCLKEGSFYPLWAYRDLIFPYLKKLVEAAHKKGIFYVKHTDGNIWLIIDGLVETGIDALHSIDPSAGMKLAEVKQRFGDKLALCGNVDAAKTMAYGTPKQVIKEARQCIKDAAAEGGYFLTTSNCIYKGVPPANAIALSETGKKYGRYPVQQSLRS
jgi:uroporphyrinogen decarboxylase